MRVVACSVCVASVAAWLCLSPLVGGACGAAAARAQAAGEAERVERLAALGRVWAAAKFFHPYLAYRDIDWDAAAVAAIPKVNAARDAGEYAAAVQSMLDALGDPATRAVPPRAAARPAAQRQETTAERHPVHRLTADGVLVVTVSNYADLTDFVGVGQRLQAAAAELPKARSAVFDLRPSAPPGEEGRGAVSYFLSDPAFVRALIDAPASAPGERFRMHSGLAPQDGSTSGGYYSAFYTVDGRRFAPGKDAKGVPVVFVVNRHGELPASALALQAAGKAAIVVEGDAPGDAAVVTKHVFELPGGVTVQMRRGELVNADGTSGLRADAAFPERAAAGDEDRALAAALALARDFKVERHAGGRPLPALGSPPAEKVYAETPYPSAELRLLAAFRVWAVFNYFFPYKDLMREDWDATLREFIPRMEGAKDATEYHLAVAEMTARTHDTHVGARSQVLNEHFGVAPPPFVVRMIEGAPVVTRLLDEAAARAAGVSVGDVVVSVDGERVGDRRARLAKYVSASTPQALDYLLAARLLRGAEGSTAALVVSGADGKERDVKLTRRADYLKALTSQRGGDVIKLLPGNVGYADLERLNVPEVDQMFERFKDTRAIVFDMRGYPRGTAWAIAPRLAEQGSVVAALFQRPVAMSPDGGAGGIGGQSTIYSFAQHIPRSDKWKYKGRTVMLIDERAISQSEHTGLFFEAANGTKFVGSHSNGANGDVTRFFVPGGIGVSLSGHSVRHADGRQLQRVGLVPDVEVRPTIKGVREGRDEVLERALEYLRGGR